VARTCVLRFSEMMCVFLLTTINDDGNSNRRFLRPTKGQNAFLAPFQYRSRYRWLTENFWREKCFWERVFSRQWGSPGALKRAKSVGWWPLLTYGMRRRAAWGRLSGFWGSTWRQTFVVTPSGQPDLAWSKVCVWVGHMRQAFVLGYG
jgi:hypothetical protein